MNDVGGSDSGRGLRAVKSSRTSDSNFEYDDSEWDVGIGNLIIDLDADIEKTNEAATRSGTTSSSQLNLARSTLPSSTTSSSQMHIPQSPATATASTGNNSKSKSSTTAAATTPGNTVLPLTPSATTTGKLPAAPVSSSEPTISTNSAISVSMEHTAMSDKGLKMKIKRSKPGTKSVEARHEIVKSDVLAHSAAAAASNSSSITSMMKGPLSINESKSSFNLSSQKDGKDSKGGEKDSGQDTSGQNDQNSSKVKTPKRPTSTHKKVKLATGVTASIVSTKKETTTGDPKSAPGNLVNTSLSNSHAKDVFNSTNSNSMSNISSAFAKTSTSSSNIKIPSSQNSSDLNNSNSNSAAGTTTNCRSLHSSTPHNTTSSVSHTHLTTASPSKVTEKTVNSSNASGQDKGSSSGPAYGKKARVGTYNSEKNSTNDVATPISGNNAIGFSSLSYRSCTPGGEVVVTTSSSGGTNFALGNVSSVGQPTKESNTTGMSSRIPAIPQVSFQDACVGTTVGTVTEPDCLGPCEPGTSVTLEGIVWHETESGVLVVNVTWRGKTYVGTLLDCTKSDWASPRFCDSPTSDLEMRTPKNRGKRGRAQTATPVSDPGIVDASKSSSAKLRNGAKGRRGATNAAFIAPVSPLKPDQWQKRKTRGSETESQEESNSTSKSTKRLKLNKDSIGRHAGSPAPSGTCETPGPYSPALIECPEPNCSKKYKHINGLRYHQSHAHSNNFAAEDSDSNMSTTSNTNINSVADSSGPPDDVPMESRIDVDAIEASGTDSAPTTPVKKQTSKQSPETEDKEKGDEVVIDLDMKIGVEAKISVPCKLSTGIITPKEKEDGEKLSEKTDSPGNKEKELPMSTGLSSRTPILTVPTLPFMSLQNRNQHSSLHRVGNTEGSDKPNRDQETNVMSKIGQNTNASTIPSSKGISWQPHAISPFHTQPSLNIPVTLNIPMGSTIISRDHDKGTKESKSSNICAPGSTSPSKKPKHKKKSKSKGDKDRERDREKSKSSDYMNRDTIKPGLFSPTAIQREKERGFKGQDFSPRRDTDNGGGHGGENPQSPAYSDISDANDSGPESDMNLDGKDQPGKNIGSDLKKDGSSGQNLSSFYSPFYTPMESPYLSSSNPPGQVKAERNSGPAGPGVVVGSGASVDDQGAEKFKSKSSSLPQHISGHMDDRRSSPKLDYHHQKYLSPQPPHYFPYSYPNYHFDQGYPGLISDSSYSHNNRSIIEEKERETEEQRIRLNSKGRMTSDGIKEEVVVPTNLSSAKSEPVGDRGDSHRPSALEDKSPSHPAQEAKTSFPGDYQEKRHGASGILSYVHTTSNKHSKESRRERDERHAKDGDGKESGKGSMRGSDQSRHKNMETNSEKETKNEGTKPTMETQGPPPPPTAGSYAYYPPSYLQGNPYSLPFDPNHHIFRQVMVPSPYPGSPYMHPHAGNIPRFSQPPAAAALPEDLSRPNPAAPPPKALDILQHHAAQYYASHKIHELQERALKSPSPQINASREANSTIASCATNLSSTSASPNPSQGRGSIGTGSSSVERKQATDLTKEVKPSMNPLSGPGSGTESSRSPPVHHVHTHMHSHTHIGYPIIPTVPPQYSPNLSHYGVLTTPAAAPPASVIPPFTSQKPS